MLRKMVKTPIIFFPHEVDNFVPRTGGIYIIKNVINKKVYVGSSTNFYKRKQRHWSLLTSYKHYNCRLQNSFNKYGPNNFIFGVVEHLKNKSLLICREQFWIDKFNSYLKGYNARPKAHNMLGFKFSNESKLRMSRIHKGRRPTPEALKNMRKASSKRRGVPRNPEISIKISKANKGHKLTPEQKQKAWLARKNSPLVAAHMANLMVMAKGRKISAKNRKNLYLTQEKRVHIRLMKGDFVGVSWDKKRKLWLSKIKLKGKTKNLGRFKTPEEAHQAYIRERYV